MCLIFFFYDNCDKWNTWKVLIVNKKSGRYFSCKKSLFENNRELQSGQAMYKSGERKERMLYYTGEKEIERAINPELFLLALWSCRVSNPPSGLPLNEVSGYFYKGKFSFA